MKIAITGKGGVGKTFITGTLARLLARDGFDVLAIDIDPAMNLSYALGIKAEMASKIIPISENQELIEERVGTGPVYSLTPNVKDIAEKYGVKGPEGVLLLVMGTVRSGGSGCMCNANSLIHALIRHLMLERKDVVIMDTEAGLEHLGRATVKGFEILLCVVEPGKQSLATAKKISDLAKDLGIKKVFAIANKIMKEEDMNFIEENLKTYGIKIMGSVPFDEEILKADNMAIAPIDFASNSNAVKAIKGFKDFIEKEFQ
ncbi:MAG: AAA family ATPase [Candidatus Bathyarchaeota archaeon]|nr:AAA family ATPase [Candidatus Bathyarchaeota archaeon]